MSEDRSRAIAVIGMAGRFPGAPDLDAYWRNIVTGVESVSTIPRPEAAAADAALPRGSKWIGVASTIEGIEEFDAEYFGMSRMEAEILDPQQRVLLECAVNAFDSAGHDPRGFDGAVGVYVGLGFSTYLADNIGSRADIMEKYGRLQLLRGNDRDYGPTRISYYLNLRGPSMAISCACSTSLVAIHQACSSLLSFECDLALAGGARIDVSANRGYLHQEGGTVSADGHCRPFDARASGTVFGSGAGLVMLRRYEDAVKARDNIHALILGSSVNNDGSDKVGYAAPGIRGPADVIAEALAVAEASSDTVGYIEANGAATQMGDAAEIAALANAFARKQNGQKKPFCAVGSVKANIGHLDVAAGVAGFIKTVQALKHREIPPCLHFEAANPQIRLENGPFYINSKPLKWTADRSPLRAGVSAFGIGGTNAHIVLEEAPPRPPEGSSAARSMHVVTLSGHKPEALKILRARFAQFLAAPASTPRFSDICATSSMGRAHHRYRMAVVAGQAIAASRLLAEAPGAGEGCLLHGVAKNMPRLRFQMGPLSPEQASRLGACEDAPEAFRQAWHTCRTSLGGGCARSTIFTAYYAMAAAWRAWGISPDEIRGNSIGMLAVECAFARRKLDAADQLLRGLSLDGAETMAIQDTHGAHTVMHLGHRMEVKDVSLSQQVTEGNHDLPAQFTLGVANLYVLGFDIDWKAVNSGRAHHRVELPAYPFIRKRYWIDRAAPSASPLQAPRVDARPGYVTQSEIESQLLTWFDDARTRPADDIDGHHFIGDYGIDSLHLLDLLTRVSRHYQIDLTMTELEDVEMIEDLARFVAQKVNGALMQDRKLAASRARTDPVPSRERIERLMDNYAHAFAGCAGFRGHLLQRTNGGTTEILDMGSGLPILLLPPLGCIGAAFMYQARYLAQTHRVLTFHYPGYGRSTFSGKEDLRSAVTDIARCLDHLVGGNACHVMGWSLGGIVGQMLASEYPDLVRSLMLVNTSAKLDGDGSLAGIVAMAQRFTDDFAENMPEWMRDRREGQLDFIRAGDSAVVSGRFMAAVQAFDGRERLAAITVPTLVVSGGQDRIVPARHGQDLARRLSRSTYKELATGGHYIPLFNADWFNQQIAAFIDAMRS
jgi:3-oxoacyl-(acyl-carrier-protein) synthase/pimeloyl-ACP methyl ester carboxylesterase/acyl carrier protein